MGGTKENHDEVLALIQSTYVPFLKKLIAHLGKKKDSQPKTFEKLKYVYQTFLEADSKEKFDVYNACKDMLERWYKRYKDMRAQTSDKKSITSDAAVVSEDSQSDASLSNVKVESKNTAASKSGLSIVSVVSCSNTPNQSASVSQKSFTARQDGVYFQDEIEIESSDSSTSYSILPVSSENKTEKFNPNINIKKEKDPIITQAHTQSHVTASYGQPKVSTPQNVTPTTIQNTAQVSTVQPTAPEEPKEIIFVCASCQFRTANEADFMKHARTDHRTDLSLWCKQCGKCFSNAGVLVAHIKENNCQKEDMIYRCGVKDCTFETPSGQTFVHHLRHCHKGSPFIFCIHCQKIFTLPHCLILHMQNECPFKEKNRRNPGSCPPTPAPAPAPTQTKLTVPTPPVRPPPKPQVQVPTAVTKPLTPIAPRTPASNQSSLSTAKRGTASRGRGGRGRSRVPRSKFSDSSDSDDPDDPSWKPEENLNNQPLRRSARWAKKVVDAKDPDLYDSDSSVGKQKKSEQPGKTFFYCPCCDFSALFKSLLEDHYVTDHKNPKRNSCMVCSVKFESKQYFIDHFSIHEKEKAEGKAMTNVTEKVDETSKNSQSHIPVEIVPQAKTIAQSIPDSIVKIPYQTAIQEKLQKESKLKSFEDLKSPNDILKMKTETKLQHFFKCVIYNCSYTTDDNVFYVNHLNEHHKGKKFHCVYCLDEFLDAQVLSDHMLKDHGKRCYQCSLCFYRGSSKPHVQIHIRNIHTVDKAQVHKSSQHLPPGYDFKTDNEEETDLTTTWPYVCAVGDCNFKTYDPKEFKKHNDMSHRSVSVFFCHYCKVDFISFKRLMSHYHLHGINNFQCTYCVHGSDTREEILIHLCNNHADKPFKVHVRTPQDGSVTGKKAFAYESSVTKEQFNASQKTYSAKSDDSAVSTRIRCDVNADANLTYPSEILSVGMELFCRLGFCGELLDDVNLYVNHLVTMHCASNILCPYCSFVSDKISEFQKHLLCHGPNLFACVEQKCDYCSQSENDVMLHMINSAHHLENASPKVIRKVSGAVVPEIFISENWIRQIENGSVEGFVCLFCYYTCSKRNMMKNHLYVELVYRRFQCNLCKIKCYSRGEAKKHFRSFHSHHNIKCAIDGNAEIECLVRNFLLTKVQRVVTKCLKNEKENWLAPSGLPSSKCKSCSVCLPTVRELHHHLISCVSHDYQPYICNHCGAKTTDLVRMKCHTAEVHPGDRIKYSTFPNKLLEEQHGRKLQELRLGFLKDFVSSVVDRACLDKPKLIPKYYKCAYCKFIDNFRSNIEKHCLGCHKDRDVEVEKIREVSPHENTAKLLLEDENPDDSSRESSEPMDTRGNEHYLCVYCTKKTSSLGELEKHVISHHKNACAPDTGVYAYFYCPDPDYEYSANDTELYECAYCSVSQENLYHLKRHCNNLHSEATFQVRGHKSKDGTMFKCDYCEYRVVNHELLLNHCRFHHLGKPVKSSVGACGKQTTGNKRRGSEEIDSKPNKCAKIGVEVYQCLHCGKESDMMMKITAHSETAHPDLPLKYKTVVKPSDDKNMSLLYCDFCSFIGDQKLLKQHIRQKHKSCVCCGYCKKYLESVSALELHTGEEHKGQCVNMVNISSSDSEGGSSDELSSTSQEIKKSSASLPCDGKKREPIDLRSITVNIKNEETAVDAKLPVVYLAEMFPIFPKVVLHDFNKNEQK